MRWLLAALCIIAIAAPPAAASANTEDETVSTKSIVIAYIPEHLQRRVPGHQQKHQVQEVQEAPAQDDTQSFDAREAPRGLQRWHPEAFIDPAEEGLGIEYQEWKPKEGSELQRRRRALGIGLGLGIPLVALSVGLGVTMSYSMREVGLKSR